MLQYQATIRLQLDLPEKWFKLVTSKELSSFEKWGIPVGKPKDFHQFLATPDKAILTKFNIPIRKADTLIGETLLHYLFDEQDLIKFVVRD